MPVVDALLAVTRFGLGPKPGEIALAQTDPREFLVAMTQRPGSALIENPPFDDAYKEMRRCFDWKQQRRALMDSGIDKKTAEGRRKIRQQIGPMCFAAGYRNEVMARARHAVATEAPFVERLVQFWSNHFAISAAKRNQIELLSGDFERSAIRPHVLGRFREMLKAAITHPAMLIYLDNHQSVGPNSRLGRNRGRGLNENLAREVLELHTLGADGGYSQEDVINFARILTGWTTTRLASERPFAFRFASRMHEPGTITVLDRAFPDHGKAQGDAVLDMLAAHPSTARNVARRLARHFVAEDPSEALVDKLATVFAESDGDLAELARALVRADDSWTSERIKAVPPYDFVIAAHRATNREPQEAALGAFGRLGQAVWKPPSPEGWPDEDGAWLQPDGFVERIDWAAEFAKDVAPGPSAPELAEEVLGSALDTHTREMIERAESREQGLVLLLMSTQIQRR